MPEATEPEHDVGLLDVVGEFATATHTGEPLHPTLAGTLTHDDF